MIAVWKRECRACMQHVCGWLFAAILLLFCGIMVVLQNLLNGYPHIEYALVWGEYVYLLAIPFLAVFRMAEDPDGRMNLFYRALSLNPAAVEIGKYLAGLTVLAIPCAVLGLYPLFFSLIGEVNFLSAYVGLAQFFLLGAALLAVCRFLCSLTRRLAVAAVLCVLACAVLTALPLLGYVLPETGLASYLVFLVLALGVTAVVFFATRHPIATGLTAALLVIPLTLAFVLIGDGMAGTVSAFFSAISPFVQFEESASMGILSLPGLLRLVSYPPLFTFLCILREKGRGFVVPEGGEV